MSSPASSVPPLETGSVPRVAVVGIGGYGQTHLRIVKELAALGQCRLASVVAVAGTSDAELAALPARGVKVYASFGAWLDGEAGHFDLCCLPTPIHLHERMTVAALRAGGSVLLEKPLAASWPEIARLISVQPTTGRFLAVGFQDLYLREARELKAALLDGRHGRIRRIKVLGLWPRGDTYYRRNGWAGKISMPAGAILDSPLSNAFAHFLMLALFLAGEDTDEAAVLAGGKAELYRAKPIESFDTAVVQLFSRTGVEIFCVCTHCGLANETPRIEVETDTGIIEWRVWHDLRFTAPGGLVQARVMPSMEETRFRQFEQVMRRAQGDLSATLCRARLAAVHATCILDLAAGVEIQEIAPAHRGRAALADGGTVTIDGVDAALHRAFAQSRFPSELGLPWAGPATHFETAHSQRLATMSFA